MDVSNEVRGEVFTMGGFEKKGGGCFDTDVVGNKGCSFQAWDPSAGCTATVGVGAGSGAGSGGRSSVVAAGSATVDDASGAGSDELAAVVASDGDDGSVDAEALLAAAISFDSSRDRRMASMIISSSKSAPIFLIAVKESVSE